MCVYVCIHVCMDVCMYVYMYICMYVCMCMYDAEEFVELTVGEKSSDKGASADIQRARAVYGVPNDDTSKKLVVPKNLRKRKAKKTAAKKTESLEDCPPFPSKILSTFSQRVIVRD